MKIRRLALVVAVPLTIASAALAAPGKPAATPPKPAPPPAGQFRITGDVGKPLLLSTEQLAALPQVTMTVTFRQGNTPQTHTEQGPLLADVLALAKPKIDPSLRND